LLITTSEEIELLRPVHSFSICNATVYVPDSSKINIGFISFESVMPSLLKSQ